MVEVSVEVPLAAGPSRVWLLLSNFHGLAEWHPGVRVSAPEEGGRRRRLTLVDGSVLLEELSSFSSRDRSYSYAYVDGDLPVTVCTATVRVADRPGGRGAIVAWTGAFEADEGSDPDGVGATLRELFRTGLEGLAARFGDPRQLERGRARA